MAATIVMHGSRTPFPADLAARVADEQAESLGLPSIGVAGDANVNAEIPLPPGQLWERVAEGRRINYDVYPWAMLDCAALYEDNGNGPRACTAPTDWILGRHVCPVHASNGIIRAGERIK